MKILLNFVFFLINFYIILMLLWRCLELSLRDNVNINHVCV